MNTVDFNRALWNPTIRAGEALGVLSVLTVEDNVTQEVLPQVT